MDKQTELVAILRPSREERLVALVLAIMLALNLAAMIYGINYEPPCREVPAIVEFEDE